MTARANGEASLGEQAKPLVDVGMPTRGTSKYLTESIESVLAQTEPGWTLTVSENGPGSDALRRTLEPYLLDPRVRHVVTGTTVGVGANHTNAVRGDARYFAVLHDDDRWHPEFLERRIRFLETNPTCGFVYSGHIVIDHSGRALGRSKPPLSPGLYAPSVMAPILFYDNFVGVPTPMFRRTAYEQLGGEYREVVHCDHEILVRTAAQFDTGCIDVWDCEYRIHADQTSEARAERARRRLAVWAELHDVPLSPALLRRAYVETYVSSALDDIELGNRRDATRHLANAVRTAPRELVRPAIAGRMLAVVGAFASGTWGRRKVTKLRADRWPRDTGAGLLPPEEESPTCGQAAGSSAEMLHEHEAARTMSHAGGATES